jgi:hypothetical protein
MSTIVSFVIADDNALTLFMTATFCPNDGEWKPIRAACDKGRVLLGGHQSTACVLTGIDWLQVLRDWLKDNPEPRVYWIDGNGRQSQHTQCLWEMINAQREEDMATGADADTERQVDRMREMYASPVYGAV